MSFGVAASAERGWEKVPYDGALTELHKNEMVLPASVAEPIRNMASGVTQSGGGNNASSARAPQQIVTNIQVSSPDAASVANLLNRNGSALVTALNRQIAMGSKIAGGRA